MGAAAVSRTLAGHESRSDTMPSIALPYFLAGYRALLKERIRIVERSAVSAPVYWADPLSRKPFVSPGAVRGLHGEAEWRARFEALIASAGRSIETWEPSALGVLFEVLHSENLRPSWSRYYGEQPQREYYGSHT